MRAIKALAPEDFERIMYEFLALTRHQLRYRLKDSSLTNLEVAIGRIILATTWKGGDIKGMAFLIDRLRGKPRQTAPPPPPPSSDADERVVFEILDNGRDKKN